MITLKKYEKIFTAISDKSRLRIIKMLQRRPLCVCEITEILKLATSTVSKHLSVLRDAGLIIDEKKGKWINYRLNPLPKDNIESSVLLFVQLQMEEDETITRDKKLTGKVDRRIICCK